MAVLFVCYKTPADAAAFDSYYAATHITLVQRIAGLRKYNISAWPIMTPGDVAKFATGGADMFMCEMREV